MALPPPSPRRGHARCAHQGRAGQLATAAAFGRMASSAVSKNGTCEINPEHRRRQPLGHRCGENAHPAHHRCRRRQPATHRLQPRWRPAGGWTKPCPAPYTGEIRLARPRRRCRLRCADHRASTGPITHRFQNILAGPDGRADCGVDRQARPGSRRQAEPHRGAAIYAARLYRWRTQLCTRAAGGRLLPCGAAASPSRPTVTARPSPVAPCFAPDEARSRHRPPEARTVRPARRPRHLRPLAGGCLPHHGPALAVDEGRHAARHVVQREGRRRPCLLRADRRRTLSRADSGGRPAGGHADIAIAGGVLAIVWKGVRRRAEPPAGDALHRWRARFETFEIAATAGAAGPALGAREGRQLTPSGVGDRRLPALSAAVSARHPTQRPA